MKRFISLLLILLFFGSAALIPKNVEAANKILAFTENIGGAAGSLDAWNCDDSLITGDIGLVVDLNSTRFLVYRYDADGTCGSESDPLVVVADDCAGAGAGYKGQWELISTMTFGASDCSGITSGICLDTDDGKLYSWDGDSVELVGVLDYAPIANDIQAVLDCASGDCDEIPDAPAPLTANSTTPTLAGGHNYITQNSVSTVYTDFLGKDTNGFPICVLVNDANTGFDFTASGLRGNDKDFTAVDGETYCFIFSTDDNTWRYKGIPNAFSASISGGVETETIYIEDPTTETFDEIAFFGYAVTITRISCITDTGTASINFENGADNVLSAELVCDSDEQDSCASGCDVNTINGTYDNFSQYSWGDIDISATASSPTKLSIAITFTRD